MQLSFETKPFEVKDKVSASFFKDAYPLILTEKVFRSLSRSDIEHDPSSLTRDRFLFWAQLPLARDLRLLIL